MERSDRLGFVNELNNGALGYEFQSTGVNNGLAPAPFNSSLLPTVGHPVKFDFLTMPYAFALSAAYDVGK